MTGWLFALAAIASNVTANVALKQFIAGAAEAKGLGLAGAALGSPWFWICGAASGSLFLCYALALRSLDLSLAYAVVTSSALIGVSIAAWLWLGEDMTVMKIAGTALIVVGIMMISRA